MTYPIAELVEALLAAPGGIIPPLQYLSQDGFLRLRMCAD
jgi:hypothetical protein